MDNDRRNRQPMRRAVLLALGLVLAAGLVAAVVGHRAPAQAYTVAQVRAGLARQPAAWVGRTVLVRAVAVASVWTTGLGTGMGIVCGQRARRARPPALGGVQSCPLTAPHGATLYLMLADDSAPFGPRPSLFFPQKTTLDLIVQPVAPNPLIALARRLPPLARFLSAQGQVPGGVPHLYRIRLWPSSSASCASPSPLTLTCGTGVLVDAQP